MQAPKSQWQSRAHNQLWTSSVTSYVTEQSSSLGLSFLICKMGIIITPVSESWDMWSFVIAPGIASIWSVLVFEIPTIWSYLSYLQNLLAPSPLQNSHLDTCDWKFSIPSIFILKFLPTWSHIFCMSLTLRTSENPCSNNDKKNPSYWMKLWMHIIWKCNSQTPVPRV
jgi:hypothetical protein